MRELPIDNSDLEELREKYAAASARVTALDGYSSKGELEEDLKYLQNIKSQEFGSFAYLFTGCSDKRLLMQYYDLLKKYDVIGANELTEELLEEVKWEIKKLKIFDKLGD